MAKNMKLLLTESVDNLGIVGDVVNVRLGFARNFLLPRGFATTPSDEMVKTLAAKRAEAEQLLAASRSEREEMIKKLDKFELTIERSCNDQGVLYAAVTQQDVASALGPHGFSVKPREVRLHHAIKRLDTYEIHVKFAADLEAVIKLWVVPDRKLDAEEKKDEMEFDDEGELIVPGRKPRFHKPRKSRTDLALEGQQAAGARVATASAAPTEEKDGEKKKKAGKKK